MILTLRNKSARDGIRRAVRQLKKGGVIAFPTETTYGIGCDPRDGRAVRRVFRLKGRDPSKPLLLVAASLAQVECVADLSGPSRELARAHWPGPLTLILPVKRDAGLARGAFVAGEVAIRVSSSAIVRRLTHAFGFPIVATSANHSNQPECRSATAVRFLFADRLDEIVDGGTLPRRAVSTVARVLEDGTIEVARKGAVRLPSKL
ncbi:MAG: L-threonylcarbamoyladenylate synthase [Patescibacteria group bacterium]